MKYILASLLFTLIMQSCSSDKNQSMQKEEFNIVGYWKVDSVEVFRNDNLIETNSMNYFMQFTKDEIRSCSQKETPPKFEIIKSDNG